MWLEDAKSRQRKEETYNYDSSGRALAHILKSNWAGWGWDGVNSHLLHFDPMHIQACRNSYIDGDTPTACVVLAVERCWFFAVFGLLQFCCAGAPGTSLGGTKNGTSCVEASID